MIKDIPSNYGRFSILGYFQILKKVLSFSDGFSAKQLYPEQPSIPQKEKVDTELAFAVIQGLLEKNGHFRLNTSTQENEAFFKELSSTEISDWGSKREPLKLPSYRAILLKSRFFQSIIELFNRRGRLTEKEIENYLRDTDAVKSTNFYYGKAANRTPQFLAVAGILKRKNKAWHLIGYDKTQKKLNYSAEEKPETKSSNKPVTLHSIFVKDRNGRLIEISVGEEQYKKLILENFI